MARRQRRLARLVLWAGALVVGGPVAYAQIGPGGPGLTPGGGPGGGAGSDAKKEGVAEQAPKTPGLLPTTPALPAPKSRRKKWKLLEIDGYYRMRTDWFKNFNLGFPENGTGGTPFPQALGCSSNLVDHPCNGSLASANMRLRLEPTINIDEGTSVHIQADALDNLVLGSTPYDPVTGAAYGASTGGAAPPIGAFNNGTQGNVGQGVNSDRPSIQVKRVWGEVALPLGILKFGRMPDQWGMGIWHNAGGLDPINGTYNYDADYGDTVDRASFSLLIPGSNLRAMVATDWSSTRLVSNQTSANLGHEGHPYDLDDSDDSTTWIAALSRIDSPQDFKDTMARGELALNYGARFEYRTQDWDYDTTSPNFTLGGNTNNGEVPGSTDNNSPHYVPRHLKLYSPDVWLKAGYKDFTLEGEFVAQLGSVENATYNLTSAGSTDIRRFGGSGRLTWNGLNGQFKAGLESGFASGDSDVDPLNPGRVNLAYVNAAQAISDGTLSRFSFNRDYQIDMILWRHLIGAVSNAAYIKPFFQYDITHGVSFKGSNITSFALRPVATPGHKSLYGTEFDAELSYTWNGLYIGISYGVLFPLAGMDHPGDTDTQKYGFTNTTAAEAFQLANVMGAETAHTVQSRIVLSF